MTSILILPALPAALVAKQTAALQSISGGRFELGVGVSWNPLEYQALGQDVRNRGRRLEEQIELLRRLWDAPYVSFQGRWQRLKDVGLGRPPSQPIPIWIGSGIGERQLRRAARLADGWMMGGGAPEVFAGAAAQLHQYLRDAGRDPAAFKLQARLTAGSEGPDAWVKAAHALRDAGATHLTIAAPPDLGPAEALDRTIEAKKVLADVLV